MKYYYCVYQGRIGPQTSFVVPIEQKTKYRQQILDYFPIISEHEF